MTAQRALHGQTKCRQFRLQWVHLALDQRATDLLLDRESDPDGWKLQVATTFNERRRKLLQRQLEDRRASGAVFKRSLPSGFWVCLCWIVVARSKCSQQQEGLTSALHNDFEKVINWQICQRPDNVRGFHDNLHIKSNNHISGLNARTSGGTLLYVDDKNAVGVTQARCLIAQGGGQRLLKFFRQHPLSVSARPDS